MKRSPTCATRLGCLLTASLAFAQGRYPGAVALVARRGKVAYFEALGRQLVPAALVG